MKSALRLDLDEDPKDIVDIGWRTNIAPGVLTQSESPIIQMTDNIDMINPDKEPPGSIMTAQSHRPIEKSTIGYDKSDGSCCVDINRRLFKQISRVSRKVYLKGTSEPLSQFTNEVKNQKYNILTFLPLFFFHQFKAFFNIFFFAITISQFFPILQVGMAIVTNQDSS